MGIIVKLSSSKWWNSKRLKYNIGLVVSGICAFIFYAVVVFMNEHVIPDAEITIFTTLFQGIGYLLAMVAANLCYFIGPISEKIIKPKNIETYRHTTFNLGFYFSVALPFCIPLYLLFLCYYPPSWWAVTN